MIMKAPIVKSSIANDGEVVFPDLQDQRDADHQYYRQQFVKWLAHYETGTKYQSVEYCIPINDLVNFVKGQSLLAEGMATPPTGR